MITPRISKINGALLDKIDDCAPWIKIETGTCVQVPTPVSLLYFSAVIRNEPRITLKLSILLFESVACYGILMEAKTRRLSIWQKLKK